MPVRDAGLVDLQQGAAGQGERAVRGSAAADPCTATASARQGKARQLDIFWPWSASHACCQLEPLWSTIDQRDSRQSTRSQTAPLKH